jgi:urea transport system permease protein
VRELHFAEVRAPWGYREEHALIAARSGRAFIARLGMLVVVLAAVLWGGIAKAAPGDFESALVGLAQPPEAGLGSAAETIAATGDPRALTVLQALMDGDVMVRGSSVYLRDGTGALHDAATGAAASADGSHAPTVDNGVRRVLDLLITRLQLRSSDPTVRLAAVDGLSKRASDEDASALRDALAVEKDGKVRRAIASALAELDLASQDPKKRMAAVEAVERTGSIRLRSKLQSLIDSESDAKVRAAAERAVRSLDSKQSLVDTIANVLYGLSTGSVLLLTALGLAVTFGLMGVINMAHGEMLMVGAYATYMTQLFFRSHFPNLFAWYLVAAAPVALVVCMALGALLERGVIRFLYGRPLETLLATWGLSLIVIQTVRALFGAQNVAVENPPWLSGGTEIFEGVVIPYNRVAIVTFTVVVVSFLAYVLRGTSLGLRVRAVTQNRPMAACMGISTSSVDTWTFALGSGLGGLGGVALSQLGNVGPELGQGYIVDSFLVVVLGGVGKLAGTVFAAFALGISNKLLEPVAGAVLGKIVVLLAVVLVIQRRPQGLFAPRVRSADTA